MHDFHVSKVSGANGVLDIYIDTPKSSKKSSNWSVSDYYGSYIFYYDISSKYFRSNTKFSNQIFSVEHRLFKSFIFGQTPSFQTKYFRWNTDFSNEIFSVKHQVFKPNIFGQTPSFQTKYFRWNTDFSKVLFSAKHQVFKRNIFGDAGTFQSSSFVWTARIWK